MTIVTKKKYYRKTSNDGTRTNFCVMRICDFDEIYDDDAIVIRCTVLIDIKDNDKVNMYRFLGFLPMRIYNTKLMLVSRFTVKEKTLKEMFDDFGIIKE